ncbi:hypothetical protein NDU88_002838 [Pleurodeles waltl]|uniref:Uncharacterized protein n=1 Tax=Pleurodeles waltl TaxID=8319 RepID=A0AAV7MPH2_PLEWA|nr:hypothetical protein NDU88_002838 [Pleurodeles waltl]
MLRDIAQEGLANDEQSYVDASLDDFTIKILEEDILMSECAASTDLLMTCGSENGIRIFDHRGFLHG